MKRKAKVTTKNDFVHWDALAVYDIFDSEITDYEDELPLLPPSDSDEERPKVVAKENAKPVKTSKRSTKRLYQCPLCPKTYSSQSGFRGHVSKKHDRPDLKGN